MKLEQLEPGDTVYATAHIYNDGSIPALPEGVLLAEPGTRGLLVQIGHLEEAPQRSVFLVRFEDKDVNLGPPTGCWAEELSAAMPIPLVPTLLRGNAHGTNE
ncbi:MAG: nitrogen fixation protein NifZ [gamma proteobacterium symbiont of Bathyaustriella thionipta]|nr:nitrogen fixation protein NifZ [gamma proteobacterium symbiont of Bathyaustriella thionipta]